MKDFKNTLIQVTQSGMGSGDEALGLILVANYLKLLSEEPQLPKVITFYNSGVKLICEESPTLEVLKKMQEKGVKLIACKTCLNHFKLLDNVKVGIPGTMIDILELQKRADKVINI